MNAHKLPSINWVAVNPSAEFSPYTATDEFGNKWSQTANREIVTLKTSDGRYFQEWTEQECWNRFLATKGAI